MDTNVLTYLERSAAAYPQKLAMIDEIRQLTYEQVLQLSQRIGTALSHLTQPNRGIGVYMEKNAETLCVFFGAVYAGCYYSALNTELPATRLNQIASVLEPAVIVTSQELAEEAGKIFPEHSIVLVEELVKAEVDSARLESIRRNKIDTDPLYMNFTSGSTGVPKGVIGCHRAVIDYVEHLCDVLKFDEDSVFGNQTPLYFDACLKEIIPTLKYGGTTHLIPKKLFMFPVKLVEYLNEHKINTLCWVVSALTFISSFKTFDQVTPKYLRTIAFASEVFPIRQLKLWQAVLPQCRFINLYGPTETTGICCYYEVDREFEETDSLPIGRPFANTEVILLDENNQVPAPGQQGEICIRGTRLTLGYYCNPEKTSEAFVQNPLNNLYPELIYRTGDLGSYNDRGELTFQGRKDYQIKHMGHRIELGEIEVVANMFPNVSTACCVFEQEKKKIYLFYVGEATAAELTKFLKEKLPRYMIPNAIRQLDTMPVTPNGKIDRNLLKSMV